MSRYFQETECEHGEMRQHRMDLHDADDICVDVSCPGGLRRELVLDYTAAKRAYEDAPVPIRAEDFVRRIVDAAISGGTA